MSHDAKRATHRDDSICTRKDGPHEKCTSVDYRPDGSRRRISGHAQNRCELQAIRGFNASNTAPGQVTVHTLFTRKEDGWLDLK